LTILLILQLNNSPINRFTTLYAIPLYYMAILL
ncbi:unnamed protein product, partial [marine sediment metagenome]